MTVCIAAIAQYEGHDVVICCTDSRISIPEYWAHGDGPQFKLDMLSKSGVHVLVSGTLPSAADMVTFFNKRLDLESAATDEIVDRFQMCAEEYREHLVDRYLKLGWSISLEAYRRGDAATYLPPETLKRIADDIGPEKVDFECDVIFVCFDSREKAKLLTMDRFGRIRDQTPVGFAVTGMGVFHATSQLYARQYGYLEPLPRALYYVFEAKKRSESELSVGPDTHMIVADPHDYIWVDPDGIGFLEDEFTDRNAPVMLELPSYFWMDADAEDYKGIIKPYTEADAGKDDSGTAPGDGAEEAKE